MGQIAISASSKGTGKAKDYCVAYIVNQHSDARGSIYKASDNTYVSVADYKPIQGDNLKFQAISGGWRYQITALTAGKYRILNGDSQNNLPIGETIITATANQVIVNRTGQTLAVTSCIVEAL